MGECDNEYSNSQDGRVTKRPSKIRDIFTDRIVGIISGAFIPLVLLFIPLINKYLDNTKEIQTLQIQNNTTDIEHTNQRVAAITEALVGSQIQMQGLNDKLSQSVSELKKTSQALRDCQQGCNEYCKGGKR